MTPHYKDDNLTLYLGDCLDILRELPNCSVDSIVTDPPYGLGFMGKTWDALPPGEEWAVECLRVLKPGGHMLAFGGSRTWHRLAVAVEDAGFEIRDSIAWLYGSGFPKSLNVSKAIDKAAGAEREVIGYDASRARPNRTGKVLGDVEYDRSDNGATLTAPATEAARQWQGWGTALKPAFEPIVVGRKPLVGTVAANVQRYDTGALNIDACRTHTPGSEAKAYDVKRLKPGAELNRTGGNWRPEDKDAERYQGQTVAGRWPTNVVLDESQATELDRQTEGTRSSKPSRTGTVMASGMFGIGGERNSTAGADDAGGGASRFFPTFRYQAKAPKRERPTVDGVGHSTVKPLALMRWLVRLITPPGGIVLDTFMGSGTTAQASLLEGFDFIGIDNELFSLNLTFQRLGLIEEGNCVA